MKNLINKTLSNFCNLHIIQKIILLIILSSFLLLFIQSLIFFTSFETLIYVDDEYIFQEVLKDNYENIINFRIGKLFQVYSYGYGWLFWIIHTIITFPFYLTESHFLVIVMARNMSLFFMIGSCFFLFKSVKVYTKDKYIPFIVVLLFVSYPYFAKSALTFRTIAQGCFFCVLTFYLTIRKPVAFDSKRDLKYIAFSFAACLGTKISNALFGLLIAILLIDRFRFKINKNNIKNALYFLKYFIPSAIFLMNPSLFLAPFNWSLFQEYFEIMDQYSRMVQTDNGSGGNFLQNLAGAIGSDYLNQSILIVFIFMFFVKIMLDIRYKEKNKFDNLYILIFSVFSYIFLCSIIKMGFYAGADLSIKGNHKISEPIAIYLFSFSFLILFSITALSRINNFIKYPALTLLIMLNLAPNFDNIKYNYLLLQNKYYSEHIQTYLGLQKEMQKLVGDPNQKLNFLSDYRAIKIYSPIRNNIKVVTVYNNISEAQYQLKSEFDYILLHRDSKMMMNEQDFKHWLDSDPPGSSKLKNIWIESRKVANSLINTGKLKGSSYKLIYNKQKLLQKLLLFKRV